MITERAAAAVFAALQGHNHVLALAAPQENNDALLDVIKQLGNSNQGMRVFHQHDNCHLPAARLLPCSSEVTHLPRQHDNSHMPAARLPSCSYLVC